MLHSKFNGEEKLLTNKEEEFSMRKPVVYRLSSVYTHCKTIRKEMSEYESNDDNIK
ncbi:hypothetical protein PV797_10785 [Clostridiaceae bacterium M8S5]|nr:hypothetical protein PV797_10785 [Clostridiaceae bacterium M8S5]